MRSTMKIVFFLKDGKARDEDIAKKIELVAKGNHVSFSNGSMAKGFEDTCHGIIMACHNDKILEWARKSNLEIMYMPGFEMKNKKMESVLDGTMELPETTKEELGEAFELPKSMPMAVYVDPDGTEHDHKGRAFKKEFEAAIKKYGVDAMKVKEDE